VKKPGMPDFGSMPDFGYFFKKVPDFGVYPPAIPEIPW